MTTSVRRGLHRIALPLLAAAVVTAPMAQPIAGPKVNHVLGVCHAISLSEANSGVWTSMGVIGTLEAYLRKVERKTVLLPPTTPVRLIKAPQHGRFEVLPPDSAEGWPEFRYTRERGFVGKDSFSVLVTVGPSPYELTYFIQTVDGDDAASRACSADARGPVWKISGRGTESVPGLLHSVATPEDPLQNKSTGSVVLLPPTAGAVGEDPPPADSLPLPGREYRAGSGWWALACDGACTLLPLRLIRGDTPRWWWMNLAPDPAVWQPMAGGPSPYELPPGGLPLGQTDAQGRPLYTSGGLSGLFVHTR